MREVSDHAQRSVNIPKKTVRGMDESVIQILYSIGTSSSVRKVFSGIEVSLVDRTGPTGPTP